MEKEALYYSGICYLKGEGVEKNYNLAKVRFTQSALLGNEDARKVLKEFFNE